MKHFNRASGILMLLLGMTSFASYGEGQQWHCPRTLSCNGEVSSFNCTIPYGRLAGSGWKTQITSFPSQSGVTSVDFGQAYYGTYNGKAIFYCLYVKSGKNIGTTNILLRTSNTKFFKPVGPNWSQGYCSSGMGGCPLLFYY